MKTQFDLTKVAQTMQRPRFAKMVARYQFLMQNLHCVDISKHELFQITYNAFFQLRRNQYYREKHFNYLEKHKSNTNINFKEILEYLSSIQNSIEASFASKMLSIINPSMPVLDSKVLHKLGLKKPSINCPDRINESVLLYEKICEWYKDFWQTENFKECMDLFDSCFPNSCISDEKKVDFILWQMDND